MKNIKNTKIEKAIITLSENDSKMLTLIKKFGVIQLQPRRRYFEAIIRIIIGQQLSLKAADSIAKKVFNYYADKPTAEKIAVTEDKTLRSLGLSNSKVKYVKDFSFKYINKEIKPGAFFRMTNDEIIAELTKVKGIGIWSAHMFLIFYLARYDVLPYSDLGIRKAIMLVYGLKNLPDEDTVKKIAEKKRWRPYESVAALYLWKSLE
ncbi:MAG: DNA-3-methyladenine glycosylase 2 family protein [Chlorobi bacterium]|nr:DNA-3-methyladenine glycosylase 2 family protein [Chlorobiota bacterium]